jgi:hypothetical protein
MRNGLDWEISYNGISIPIESLLLYTACNRAHPDTRPPATNNQPQHPVHPTAKRTTLEIFRPPARQPNANPASHSAQSTFTPETAMNAAFTMISRNSSCRGFKSVLIGVKTLSLE